MQDIFYNRINEDYLDDHKIDIQPDEVDVESSIEHFDGTFRHKHPFLFIVGVDTSNISDAEYIKLLNKFFDKLWEMFDRCPYIKNYDRFRVVNTVSYYFNGQTHEETIDGLQFIAETGDVLYKSKNNTWFNTTISLDCMDNITSIIHMVPYLYNALKIAIKTFDKTNKVSSFTLRYKTFRNEKHYTYPGSLQITDTKDKNHWNDLQILKANPYNLSTLLDTMLAFHPTNRKADVKAFAQDICKMFKSYFRSKWIITHKDKHGLIRLKEIYL